MFAAPGGNCHTKLRDAISAFLVLVLTKSAEDIYINEKPKIMVQLCLKYSISALNLLPKVAF